MTSPLSQTARHSPNSAAAAPKMWLADDAELTPVAGHTSVNLGRLVLVWGGYYSSKTTMPAMGTVRREQSYRDPNFLFVYDTAMDKWLIVRGESSIQPPPNSGACAVRVDSKLYVFGGFVTIDNEESEGRGTSSLYCLDLVTMQWTRIRPETTDRPTPRHKLFGWHYNNKLYFFGGFGPPPDLATAMARSRNRTYLTGGQFPIDEDLGPISVWNNQTVVFDLTKRVWSLLPCTGEVPSARAAHGGCLIDAHNVVIFGGRHRAERLNDVHVLDLRTNVWRRVRPRCVGQPDDFQGPEGRSWHCMGSLGDGQSALVFGGFSTEREPLGDVWQLKRDAPTAHGRDERWTWIRRTDLESGDKRLWHTGTVVDGVLYVHGGYSTDIMRTDSEAESYHKDVLKLGRASIRPLSRLCCSSLADRHMQSWLPDARVVACLPANVAASVLYARGKGGTEVLHPAELSRTLEQSRHGGAIHNLSVAGILHLKRWRRAKKISEGLDGKNVRRLRNVYDLLLV